MDFKVTVVGFSEQRPIRAYHGPDGQVRALEPMDDQTKTSLLLELPSGEKVEAQVTSGVFSKVLPFFDPPPSTEHRPGFVCSADGFVPIRKGQSWFVFEPGSPVGFSVTVVGVEDGAVFVKPADEEAFRKAFTKHGVNKHGEPIEVLPFKFTAPGSPKKGEEWKNGTYAAHEAWTVWHQMRLTR